jgi:hypothetical protein
MDRKREDELKPHETEEEIEREAEKSRRALDEIPPPGTDPLHEGP